MTLFARFRTDANTDLPLDDYSFSVSERRLASSPSGKESGITVEADVRAGPFKVKAVSKLPATLPFVYGDASETFIFRDIRTPNGVPPANAALLDLRRLRYTYSPEDLANLQVPRGRLVFPLRFDPTRTNVVNVLGMHGAYLDTRTEIFVSLE